jgi:hypothetical protein
MSLDHDNNTCKLQQGRPAVNTNMNMSTLRCWHQNVQSVTKIIVTSSNKQTAFTAKTK